LQAAAFCRTDLPGTARDEPSLPQSLPGIQLPSVDDLAAAAVPGAAVQSSGGNSGSSGLSHLVVPPVDRATGRRPTMCVLFR
jgi:hypothetical protein